MEFDLSSATLDEEATREYEESNKLNQFDISSARMDKEATEQLELEDPDAKLNRQTYISQYKPPTLFERMGAAFDFVTQVPYAAFMEQKKNNEAAELRSKGMRLRLIGKDLTDEEKARIEELDNPYSGGRFNEANNYGIYSKFVLSDNGGYVQEGSPDVFGEKIANGTKRLYAEVSKQTAIMYSIAKTAGPLALLGGGVGALGGAVVGAATTKTPQGALAGARTGFDAGAKLLARTGVAYKAFELEAGFMRQELEDLNREFMETGVEPLTDREMDNFAMSVGLVNAALEYYGLDKILKTFPEGQAILRTCGKEGIKDLAKDTTFRSQLKAYTADLVKAGISEGSTEMLQETVNYIWGGRFAHQIRGIAPKPLADKIDEIMNAGLVGAVSAILMGGVGTTAKVTAIKVKQGLKPEQANAEAEEMTLDERTEFINDNMETLAEVATEQADTVLKGGVTYTKYKDELIKQGASEEQADSSAKLIEQAFRVITDKFGKEGEEQLKKANLEILMNNNNKQQIQREEQFINDNEELKHYGEKVPQEVIDQHYKLYDKEVPVYQTENGKFIKGETERLFKVLENDIKSGKESRKAYGEEGNAWRSIASANEEMLTRHKETVKNLKADKEAKLKKAKTDKQKTKINNEYKANLEKADKALENSKNQIQKKVDELKKEFQNVQQEKPSTRRIQEFDPAELKTDAKTFQYKENADENGVTDRLKGVEKFDPTFSGKVIVYENNKGEKFIADGHQRLGLAKRLNDPDIRLEGYLFKESEGYTPEYVRSLAAQKNIAEGSGTAVDTAKIIREIGLNNIPTTIPQNSVMVKDGLSLARLGDEAFEKVINEEIPMNYAARIADAIRTDEAKQVAAIDFIRKKLAADPKNVPNASVAFKIALDINSADTNTVTQINLFGTQELTQTLYVEKAQIVDRAIKRLQADKSVFAGLLRNQSRIESKGKNKVDKKTNADFTKQADMALYIGETLAYKAGNISEKANELAKQYADKEISLDEAAEQFRSYLMSKEVIKELFGKAQAEEKYNQRAIAKAKNIEEFYYDETGEMTPIRYFQEGLYQETGDENLVKHFGMDSKELEAMFSADIKNILEEAGVDESEFNFEDIKIYGSYVTGKNTKTSDLDVVVQYSGSMSEDAAFNILNDADVKLTIADSDGVNREVDINPINTADNGTIADYFEHLKNLEAKYNQAAKADITKTAAFKEWSNNAPFVSAEKAKTYNFEDGKKVVIELFHGTKSIFDIFDKSKKGKASDTARVGFWFSDSSAFAKNFARDIWWGDQEESVVMPVYVSMKKPKVYETKIVSDEEKEAAKDRVNEIKKGITELTQKYNKIVMETGSFAKATEAVQEPREQLRKELKEAEAKYAELRYTDPYEQLRTDIRKMEGGNAEDANFGGLGMVLKDPESVEKFVEKLKSEGYDGIIIKGTHFDSEAAESRTNNQYAVFDPEQIKSVNNRGTFDSNNPNIFYQSALNNGRLKVEGNNIYYQAAYHGSPYNFEEFSTENIGSGEGHQAHGWGLYFTQNKELADTYRKSLSLARGTIKYKGKEISAKDREMFTRIFDFGKDGWLDRLEYYLKNAEERLKEYNGIVETKTDLKWFENRYGFSEGENQYQRYLERRNNIINNLLPEVINDISKTQKQIEKVKKIDESKITGGKVFEADIPENDVLLDEDKTFDKQSKKVQAALKKLPKEILEEIDYMFENGNENTGEDIYGEIVNEINKKNNYQLSQAEAEKQASLLLNKYGIKGITYNGKQDGRCYVVFDDKAINVLEKYYQNNKRSNAAAKNLLMTHSAKIERLDDIIDSQSLIAPSMAITNKDQETLNSFGFGDIIFVRNPNKIDFKRDNIYDRDIYSSRMPQPSYKLKNGYNETVSRYELESAENTWKNDPERFKELHHGMTYDEYIKDAEKVLWLGYTPSGYRKYVPYTAENIIKEMKKDGLLNGENWGYGLSSFLAQLATKQKSMNALKKTANTQLGKVEAEVMQELKDQYANFESDLRTYAKDDYRSFSYFSDIYPDVLKAIYDNNEFILNQYMDMERLKESDPKLLQDVKEYITAAANIQRTYFEAKPMREMPIDEFSTVLVTEDVTEEQKNKLRKLGLEVIEYKIGHANEALNEAVKDIYFQFAGEKAETADKLSLKNAIKRIRNGESAETVRKETGWFKGVDDKWRYEISDEDAKVNEEMYQKAINQEKNMAEFDTKHKAILDQLSEKREQLESLNNRLEDLYKIVDEKNEGPEVAAASKEIARLQEEYTTVDNEFDKLREQRKALQNEYNQKVSGVWDMTLGDLLDHEKLYKAYPYLKNLRVEFRDLGNTFGSYGDEIALNNKLSIDQVRSTLMHEIQHYIQEVEHFARGASTNSVERKLRKAVEKIVESPENVKFEELMDEAEIVNKARLVHSIYVRPENITKTYWYMKKGKGWHAPRKTRKKARKQFIDECCQEFLDETIEKYKNEFTKTSPLELKLDRYNEYLQKDKSELDKIARSLEGKADRVLAKIDNKNANIIKSALKEYEDKGEKMYGLYELYHKVAGEVEARNTETRSNMTEAERLENSPESTADVNTWDQLVFFDDDYMFSEAINNEIYYEENFSNDEGSNNQEGQTEAEPPRGYFEIDKNGHAIINILQTGDASTIVHELGHFYLHNLEQLAEKNKRAEVEFNEILSHFGYTKKDLQDQNAKIDLHEKFARGFEAYLLEGSAPTKRLLTVFQNFKSWLKDVYNSVKDLDVEFSEAAHKLYDRIFTTDEEYEKEVLPKYQANYSKIISIQREQNQLNYKAKSFAKDAGNFITTWYDKLFLPLDTRLEKYSPELKQKLRYHTASLAAITGKDLKVAEKFLKDVSEIKKQNEEDYYMLDLALKNRDNKTVNILCEKYNLKESFEAVRDILDDIYTEALAVGLDVGYLENYYPRQVKRNLTDKFIEYIEALANKEELDVKNHILKFEDAKISLVLREMADANNSQFWTQEDKAKFLNNRIRGFGQNNILLGRNGSLKYDRAIDELDANFNQFYETMEVSLINYISSSRRVIEARKFFGGENKEVGKLRATIKRKKATLAEVQDRTPYKAKMKELNRLKYELSPLEVKLESLENQTFTTAQTDKLIEKIRNKVERLKSQVEWTEKANPFQVKGCVIKRLKDEIYTASKEIKDIIGEDGNIEDSIGQLVATLAQNGDIVAKDEKAIREMLVARFGAKSIADPARILRDWTYIATLNDVTNAITQFGDLAFSVYKYGFANTYTAFGRPFNITKEDLGLNDLIYEFSDPSNKLLQTWIKTQFKWIGLDKIDGMGKNTIIQASLINAQKQIKANNEIFDNKLKAIFGNNIEEVKKDLLSGEITDNTIIFAFNELADVQPISEDQTPELYNGGGDFMRLFYTLKTYGIKALDVARTDVTQKIQKGFKTKDQKLVKEGLKNLIRLQMLLWLFGVPIDALKDLIAIRDFNLFETIIDNLIPAFLVNRYMFRTAGREGVGAAVVDFFSPACVSVVENTGKSYAISNIPLIGKPIYNWFIKEK